MSTSTDITITVTASVAEGLVERAGLAKDKSGRYGGRYWQLDEAAMMAAVRLASGPVDPFDEVCDRCGAAIKLAEDGAWEDEKGACGCGDDEHSPA